MPLMTFKIIVFEKKEVLNILPLFLVLLVTYTQSLMRRPIPNYLVFNEGSIEHILRGHVWP